MALPQTQLWELKALQGSGGGAAAECEETGKGFGEGSGKGVREERRPTFLNVPTLLALKPHRVHLWHAVLLGVGY